ncbi:MAG TPA: hypothetical protein VGJ26_21350 [Pirellulales bacterium]|jgi:hypothetical protein
MTLGGKMAMMKEDERDTRRFRNALRAVIYLHVVGVICAGVASRLDWGELLALPMREAIFGFTGAFCLATFVLCPVATLIVLIAGRGHFSEWDVRGALGLEVLIITAQLIAMLPMVQ